MRMLMCVVVGLALLFGAVGCLSKADQDRLNKLSIEEKEVLMALYNERKAALEHVSAETDKVTAKIMDKTITMSEGEQYLKLMDMQSRKTFDKVDQAIKDAKEKYGAARSDLEAKGYGKGEMIAGFVMSVLAAVTGSAGVVRVWRGSTNNRNGDIGVRT